MTTFPSIRIEGGLLASDTLDELIAGKLTGQKPADFGLDVRRNLTDEIAAVFTDTRALWGVFQNRRARLSEADSTTTITRDAWMIPFLGLLGYEMHYNQRAHEVDGATFAVSHRAGEPEDALPVHIVGVGQDLGRIASSGRPRLSPHALVQEYLNRTEHVWGLVTDGETLRLLRDSTFVRRQAYVEFDLREMLEEQRFQDFAVLYRLLHRTRLPRVMTESEAAFVERYHQRSIEQGGRVRERLRDGVEECITRLANGFLRHPANDDLRRRVVPDAAPNERLTAENLYRQLLRLIYRLLFLLVSEDRGLVSAGSVYREHYGVARLRRLLDNQAAYSSDDDLWHSLRVLWSALTDEQYGRFLSVAPLNGELFAWQDLDDFSVTNRALLDAFWRLAYYQDSAAGPSRRVNYAALDVEELGSVYESLLDFHPVVQVTAGGDLEFALVFGSERKTTGSYYTPPQLVNELIQSALEPVLRARLAARPDDSEKAILSVRVCDPACGSGHFLLAAARRLGKELARVRTGEEEPAPERVREATREAIAHCIYGVDRNPLAVDLCRLALWLEGHTEARPLTFLDHRIRCGDSLVGVFDLGALARGVPDRAFDSKEGDDKEAARAAARRNRKEREGERSLFAWDPGPDLAALGRRGMALDGIADDSPEAIRRKRQDYQRSHADALWTIRREACDLWTAAFFQRLGPERPVITTVAVADQIAGRAIDARLSSVAMVTADRERFFHWPLEFPEVFADGGFDVLLSNPPWERIKIQEREFFAAREPAIADAPNKAARARLIAELPKTNPVLHEDYITSVRSVTAASTLHRHGGRFPLTGRGDINTYALFAELSRRAVRTGGRAGIIVQSDIATSDTCKFFFQDLVTTGGLISLHDFVNTEGIFPAVHRTHPHFCLLTMSTGKSHQTTEFSFWNTNACDLRDDHRKFTLTAEEIALLNPNTHTCPIFRTQADAELTKAIYRRVPVLWREAQDDRPESNPWRLSFRRLFDMANDSHHFRTASDLTSQGYRREGNHFVGRSDRYLPLYEAKMLHQFDHRWATYDDHGETRDVTPEEKRDPAFVVQPRYWVREDVVEDTIPKYPEAVAAAARQGDEDTVERLLRLWAAACRSLSAKTGAVHERPAEPGARRREPQPARAAADPETPYETLDLARDFPLEEADIRRIESGRDSPMMVARDLIDRFSPKWLMGWRDITNTTNERTLIASVLPKMAVGHKVLLIFSSQTPGKRLLLLANLNSAVADYCSRQKLGGTSFTYFTLRQIPMLPPACYGSSAIPAVGDTIVQFVMQRAFHLAYNASDLEALASEFGNDGPPVPWDEARRFEIRCELDAAFLNLYLPADLDGSWRPARISEGAVVDETEGQLAALKQHFRTPRDAVAYILDQFPIVREKDEAAHGRYRTKERILEHYDAMLAAGRAARRGRST